MTVEQVAGHMVEELRRRAETPNEEFVAHVPGDFERILDRVLASRGNDPAVGTERIARRSRS